MLELKNITKIYGLGDTTLKALDSASVSFRESEFVSILGPSGCGKTTMLNIIGGLDKYTSGDLVVDGVSTKDFKDRDWDAYRNLRIGFVFQNYNLITHLSILANVELALTLSGISVSERRRRAVEALEKVGLGAHKDKKPNQLSGGQMQRVAIARALINDPEIILADEPTGALDSQTSVQIMEILKEVSKERLIIMVTHNSELAKEYSTRIVKLRDGEIISDSNPYDIHAEKNDKRVRERKKKDGKTSMTFWTALKLSGTNLKTKKGRSIITSFAGSIGIIGVALVLAISNGFSVYISKLQTDALSSYPIEVSELSANMNAMTMPEEKEEQVKYPTDDFVLPYDQSAHMPKDFLKVNLITDEYLSHIDKMDKELYTAVDYKYGVGFKLAAKTADGIYDLTNISKLPLKTMVGDNDFVKTQYDLLYGSYPEKANQIVMIVDRYNNLDKSTLQLLGYDTSKSVAFSDIVGDSKKSSSIAVATNDDYYVESNKIFSPTTDAEKVYNGANAIKLEIVGILRANDETSMAAMSSGLYYTEALTEAIYNNAKDSKVVKAQLASETIDVTTGQKLVVYDISNMFVLQQVMSGIMLGSGERYPLKLEDAQKYKVQSLGGDKSVIGVRIFPTDFKAKENIMSYLDEYNEGKDKTYQVEYMDKSEIMTSMMNEIVTTISVVLVAFAAVSLVVSSIMIGVITYVSVVERTKEIGILRSIGARKRDISSVFNAETFIIGMLAGLFGIVITYILSIPINIIVKHFTGIGGMAMLSPVAAIIMVAISIGLTLIAGLVPSRIAAKKDPVVALRSE